MPDYTLELVKVEPKIRIVNDTPTLEIASAGAQGPPGPVGPTGGEGMVYTPGGPASTWPITHGLGRIPHAVTVYIAGELVDADVHVDTSSVVITFATPQSGEAHIL